MKVMLFDHMDTPPRSKLGHIIVYSGISAEYENMAVTYVDCVYAISGHLIEFRKNADLHAARFEDALKWAIKHAHAKGISEVYAVFTLGRPLDMQVVRRICSEGFVDCRRYQDKADDALSEDQTGSLPSWHSMKPKMGSRLKRGFSLGRASKSAEAS